MSDAAPIYTTVLGLPWASSSTTFACLDVLASVGRDWEMLHGRPQRPGRFRPSLRSLDGRPFDDLNGRRIAPDGRLTDSPEPDLVIVPDLHLDPSADPPPPFDELAAWLRAAHASGALVTSFCSGAWLVAASGLLDGAEATTPWAYYDVIEPRHPEVRIKRERILVPAGDGHRVITAGGASAWADLLLYLISRLVGPDEARRIAKVYLLDTHDDGQLCYASLAVGRQHEDRVVAEAQIWVAEHYDTESPVATMARRAGLSERGFLRRFKRATGQSPTEYVQSLRVEEAKQMLETTELPIDTIAREVGYTEPSSFRTAFRKFVGLSASVYRRKWKRSFLRASRS
jgi:transcriptional regulator GlxA family with amidase domain